MQIRQSTFLKARAEAEGLADLAAIDPHLVMAFAPDSALARPEFAQQLKQAFPRAQLVGCSSAAEIGMRGVSHDAAVVTALRFKQPNFQVARATLKGAARSRDAGRTLGRSLARPDLKCVLMLCPGEQINGSALVDGMVETLGEQVLLAGGMASDTGPTHRTWMLYGDEADSRSVIGVGFYGDDWRISHGSFGGWQPHGPARRITRCARNVLYELDGLPALEVYRSHIGEYASGLPATAVLFPYAMQESVVDHSDALIRAVIGIDEAHGALLLAGDIANDRWLRLMHASNEALVDGAEIAAQTAQRAQGDEQTGQRGLALMVSGLGRKLAMGGRADEEVEAVGSVFGTQTMLAGFYANGEISPRAHSPHSVMHNQTVAVTYLGER